MDKKIKKWIVNGLTGSRVIGTFLLPVMFNSLSAPFFILVVGLLLLTDFIDGSLARKWEVSTIFGSLLDMGADKAFGIAVLIALTSMYPIMWIPALLEGLIIATNIISTNNGDIGKSSELGRVKMWVVGFSICTLFLTGMSKELIDSLSNVNLNNNFQLIINSIKSFIINVKNNKEIIEPIAVTTAIVSESVVAGDYIKKAVKNSKNNINKENRIKEIIKDKEKLKYIRKVLLDEKYYEASKDMNLLDKLDPTEEQKEEIKKLILQNVDK